MHRDRLQKYVQNWEDLLDFRSINPAGELQRFVDLLDQNRSFINNTRRRLKYQEQILANRDLHPYIVHLASMHSTSGSLQTYAEALRFLAITGKESLRRAGSDQARNEVERDIQDRFRFLYRKQRAHPGFDLHALLLSALRCMDHGPDGLGPLSGVRRVLLDLDRARMALGSGSGVPSGLSADLLESFRTLPARLAGLVAASRAGISEGFKEVYDAWFADVPRARYVVSHGYSRTVLSVLKRSLPPQEDAAALPRLYFVLSEKEEKESLDTRIMEYELKEDRNLRRFRNLAAGGEDHLLGLLGKGDAALILLGAECFDVERRMVHPRGFGRGLGALLRELEKCGIPSLVAVVAESYKRHSALLTADTNFYGQHFDRIDLYPPELVHLIVTDEGTLPGDWRTPVEKRRLLATRKGRFFSRFRSP